MLILRLASLIRCRHSFPTVFLQSVFRITGGRKWCTFGRSEHTRACKCGAHKRNQMRSARPWMQRQNAHRCMQLRRVLVGLLSAPFVLLVPSFIDPMDLPLGILYSCDDWTLSSVDPVHLHYCDHLGFNPVHLSCRFSLLLYFLYWSDASSLQSRTQLHWRVVSWRDERTLHYVFSRGTKTSMKPTTLTWGRARRCRRRTCFSCRELMLERILLRSSYKLLTMMTYSCSHTRAENIRRKNEKIGRKTNSIYIYIYIYIYK